MADLKLNGVTPDGIGKIKLGSTDVQEIYMGNTLVWPTEVEICDLIWTDTNSSETELTAGGNMPILTNQNDWYSAWQAQTPAACYIDFDSNNSSYGLLYNYWARTEVKPPLGFRLPTPSDFSTIFNSPCFTGPNFNRYGADPGNWDPSQLTNTTELGDSGFNSQGYGYGLLNQFSGGVTFPNFQTGEAYWNNVPAGSFLGPGVGFAISVNALTSAGFSASTAWMFFIRFVKDA